MQTRPVLVLAFLLLVTFAGCTTPGGQGEILAERPIWETGYSWHWEKFPGRDGSMDEPMQVNLTVLRPITLDLAGLVRGLGRRPEPARSSTTRSI